MRHSLGRALFLCSIFAGAADIGLFLVLRANARQLVDQFGKRAVFDPTEMCIPAQRGRNVIARRVQQRNPNRLLPVVGVIGAQVTEWANNYRIERNTTREYYSLQPVPTMEAELAQASRRADVKLAFSGFSGAARLAPAVRYQRITAYILGDVKALVDRLDLKPVSTGANVTLWEPYDQGVLYGTRDIEGAPVVSPVQLYLDLVRTKGRSEEAASAILEEVIKPTWR